MSNQSTSPSRSLFIWSSSLLVVLFSSCFNGFIRTQDFITAKDIFPKDSVTVLEPLFSTWSVTFRTRANFEWEMFGDMVEVGDRADTIRKILRDAYKTSPITDTAIFRINSGCLFRWQLEDSTGISPYTIMRSSNDSSYGFSILNPDLYRCLPLDSARYNVLNVFVMSLWSNGIGDVEIRSVMQPYVIVLYKNRIIYYRHYHDGVDERRRDFPKGSWDRKNYPYFPRYQMERVVVALNKDLISRIR